MSGLACSSEVGTHAMTLKNQAEGHHTGPSSATASNNPEGWRLGCFRSNSPCCPNRSMITSHSAYHSTSMPK